MATTGQYRSRKDSQSDILFGSALIRRRSLALRYPKFRAAPTLWASFALRRSSSLLLRPLLCLLLDLSSAAHRRYWLERLGLELLGLNQHLRLFSSLGT